ncbi:hypothetical protein C5614_10730 [Massilia phosphatilytica]|nr:hypothetical protein C5614_10730 [Massilia phosphatilytica]
MGIVVRMPDHDRPAAGHGGRGRGGRGRGRGGRRYCRYRAGGGPAGGHAHADQGGVETRRAGAVPAKIHQGRHPEIPARREIRGL